MSVIKIENRFPDLIESRCASPYAWMDTEKRMEWEGRLDSQTDAKFLDFLPPELVANSGSYSHFPSALLGNWCME